MHCAASYLLKHCMLHGVDEIVDVCISYTTARLPWQRGICMIICHACTMGYICNRHIFCCQTLTGKSTMWGIFSWSVMVNACIRLNNDWTLKYEPHLKQCILKQTVRYMLPNKATVRYPKLMDSCCLWSNNPSCNKIPTMSTGLHQVTFWWSNSCPSVTYDNMNCSTAYMLLINVRSSENVGRTC